MIKGKRILVTGGAGSIGSELVRQLALKNKVFILDNNETATFDLSEELSQKGLWVKPRVGDVRDKDTVRDLFVDFKPQYIFHCAAYKHVSPMEMYPKEAIDTNVLGTYNILNEAYKWECLEKFVYISTDKVVHANSVMGATKRVGEIMVKNKGGIAVRFGNVMGSRGSVIPIWQKQMDEGKPLTITHPKMKRYMMTIPEACELVIGAAEEGKGGEVFILDMGNQISIIDLAREILQKSLPNAKHHERESRLSIIGLRPGETLDERLMSEEEEKRAIRKDKFFIIK